MMVGDSLRLEARRIECKRERYRNSGTVYEYDIRRRRKSTGGMFADAHRAMNRSLLVALSHIVADSADVSAIGADGMIGGKSGRRQCGEKDAGKNDIQDKRIGSYPCRTYADDSFARCVFHSRSPSPINMAGR